MLAITIRWDFDIFRFRPSYVQSSLLDLSTMSINMPYLSSITLSQQIKYIACDINIWLRISVAITAGDPQTFWYIWLPRRWNDEYCHHGIIFPRYHCLSHELQHWYSRCFRWHAVKPCDSYQIRLCFILGAPLPTWIKFNTTIDI